MRHAPLQQQKKNYSYIHREALAIVWAVMKFHQYLLGRQCIINSEHKPLLALFGKTKLLFQRWQLVEFKDGHFFVKFQIYN
jgi:hypothetical protein